jgi:hypothetical protein
MNCRHCRKPLKHVFLDLGTAPPSNAYLGPAELQKPELYYPLKLYVCDRCWLVQTEDYAGSEELFRPDYAYFSSTSTTWLDHAASYTEMICRRLGLDGHSFVLEIGANDGYLLKNFITRGIPCLGIEPTAGTAAAAERLGIPIVREFFGGSLVRRLTEEGRTADLIIGNNVYAHVPDINDFTAGLQQLLHPKGTVTLEFPHLLRLMAETQFDTVYHEHFSYLSLYTVDNIFRENGLKVHDVEQLPTHGGSLRVYGCHGDHGQNVSAAVADLIELESRAGLRGLAAYCGFQERADKVKNDLLAFLLEQKKAGKIVVGYGAAAKGNTLLNYAGVKPDLLPFVCDAAPSKQGKYLPGSRIPIMPPAALREHKPDYVLVLPWNLAGEVMRQHGYVADWGGVFIVAVPTLRELK